MMNSIARRSAYLSIAVVLLISSVPADATTLNDVQAYARCSRVAQEQSCTSVRLRAENKALRLSQDRKPASCCNKDVKTCC